MSGNNPKMQRSTNISNHVGKKSAKANNKITEAGNV
jgi:hypothetical protein